MKYQKDSKLPSNAVFGAALFFLGPAAIDWLFRGFTFELYDQILTGGAIVLFVMAILARWSALIPSLLSALVVASWLTYLVARGIPWRPIDWVLNLSCLLLTLIAVVVSTADRARTSQMKPDIARE